MKKKTNARAVKQKINSPTTPSGSWEEFSMMLTRQGVNEGTVEAGTTRLTLPVSYSDPEDGFDALLHKAWFLTYGGPRRLIAAPLHLKAEYLAHQEAELCGKAGVTKGAFQVLYVQEAQMLHLDCRRRWTIPFRLFAFLEMGENRSVVLRPGEAWITIIPKDVDDKDINSAIMEIIVPPISSGAQT